MLTLILLHGMILRKSINLFFFLLFIYFNWRLITLQYCIGFALTSYFPSLYIHKYRTHRLSSSITQLMKKSFFISEFVSFVPEMHLLQ